MGSRSPATPVVPGPPSREELAYLAGLFDRGGGLTLDPPGLKIACHPFLAGWLLSRFGGHFYPGRGDGPRFPRGYWWLCRQAEMLDTCHRLETHVIERRAEFAAMRHLLEHLADPDRPYHGGGEWALRRDQLKELVRELRRYRTTQR